MPSSMQNNNGLNLQILKAKFIFLMFNTKQKVDFVTLVNLFYSDFQNLVHFLNPLLFYHLIFLRDYEQKLVWL